LKNPTDKNIYQWNFSIDGGNWRFILSLSGMAPLTDTTPHLVQACLGSWISAEERCKLRAGIFGAIGNDLSHIWLFTFIAFMKWIDGVLDEWITEKQTASIQ
jgi:hypothetical protein